MLDGLTPYSALQSLNMLTQTEGVERTESKLLTPPRGAAEEERNSSGFKDFSGFLLTPPSALPSPALHVDLFLVIPCQTIFPGLRDCACMCIGIRITWVHRGATWSFKQSLKSRRGAWGWIDGGMDVGVEPSLDGRQHLRAHLKPGAEPHSLKVAAS
ncbi:unnamed protein product [Pleuronectes platessa]|uniref:Uncharacterized protein n=1 Tax=Pleuronectes platessa TaxID=8262 RepID=A0A9N7Z3Y6_PLEPL|nr:unnamed protein product [Pleuronectes platessa]